jgi:hypothetical protein
MVILVAKQLKSTYRGYAKSMAMKDFRFNTGAKKKILETLDYTNVPEQPKHIDLISPNFQFGLIITNNVPSTLAYTTNTHIKTPDNLVQYSWTDCPPSLPNKMNSNKKVVKRLLEFGDVLSSTIDPANFPIMYDNDGNLC